MHDAAEIWGLKRPTTSLHNLIEPSSQSLLYTVVFFLKLISGSIFIGHGNRQGEEKHKTGLFLHPNQPLATIH